MRLRLSQTHTAELLQHQISESALYSYEELVLHITHTYLDVEGKYAINGEYA